MKNQAQITVRAFKDAIERHLSTSVGIIPELATHEDYYQALAYTVRDQMMINFSYSLPHMLLNNEKRVVCYFSAEYLMGPQLGNNLLALGITETARKAIEELGLNFELLLDCEPEPGLGNGGLGRLAACYMDSFATTGVPALGYGIRYEFGLFEQEIKDGCQAEKADMWLSNGFPWEIQRPRSSYLVGSGGRVSDFSDAKGGNYRYWEPARTLTGIPCEIVIPAYGSKTISVLRLFKAAATKDLDFEAFNTGDYYRAVNEKVTSENISKVLYPNDERSEGKQLRLKQQYFFVSCALQEMLSIIEDAYESNEPAANFANHFVVQLNDTHPAIAVAELMRLLVDDHRVPWEIAWDNVVRTFAYTNHTLLPEALEKWPVRMFAELLPRHLEIIMEINRRFLIDVRGKFPGDEQLAARVSIIDESGEKFVRMAHLACVGSHAVNGVARLHSELLKTTVLKDFFAIWPEKFHNITNGVTPRRFMALINPGMTELIEEKIDGSWLKDLSELRRLEPYADDAVFRDRWREAKLANKKRLAAVIEERTGVRVNPDSLFDVQVKRIHEYKRQLMNILHVIALYNRIKSGSCEVIPPRTVIFGGKAAPGYYTAKLIIRLINSVAEVVNNDTGTKDLLKVVFFPNYNVKNGSLIFPAADLSEQISTAGLEASGTGNMKMAMNGALTIGTLDGANVEIREEVGAENFYLFGNTVEQVEEIQRQGYCPGDYIANCPELQEVLAQIECGMYSNGDCTLFAPLVRQLRECDQYLLCADFADYLRCQRHVEREYLDRETWVRKSILNVARMGKFSSDRATREYSEQIWNLRPKA